MPEAADTHNADASPNIIAGAQEVEAMLPTDGQREGAEWGRRTRRWIAEHLATAWSELRYGKPTQAVPVVVVLRPPERVIRKGSDVENEALRVDREVDERIETGRKLCWEIGKHDGSLRSDYDRGRTVAFQEASDVYGYLETFYKGEAETTDRQRTARTQTAEERQEDHHEAREHRAYLEKEYRRYPRLFSWPLGLFYVFSAIVLVLADIPLAVSLTADAFDYRMITANDLELLVTSPLQFVGQNWKALLVSTGIAFFAVFIKMYWDEFVGRPKELSVTMFKGRIGIDTDDEIKVIHRVERTRFWAKTAVLAFTLTTLVTLGLLRNQSEESLRVGDAAFESALTGPSDSVGDAPPLASPPENGFFLAAFIFITLMFPLIGGIAASIGLGYLESRVALQHARRSERTTQLARDAAVEQERQATYAATRARVRSERIKDTYRDDLRRLFVANYEHGYQTGFLSPSTGGDTFALAQRLHQWAQARQALTALWQMGGNPEKPPPIGSDLISPPIVPGPSQAEA